MLRKPIKRSEHIRKLSRDHHFSLLFCWKIRKGLKTEVAPERIRLYVEYFWEHHLQPHFREEERILFAPFDDRQIQRAVKEHKQIQEVIEDLGGYSKLNEKKLLTEIADMVDEHVRYEERELFPYLEQKLNKEQLETIGRELQKNHLSLQDDYTDIFWNR